MDEPNRVISTRYPFLPVRAIIRGHLLEASALVDTGFDGYLAVPSSVISEELGDPDSSVNWAIAGGDNLETPIYYGSLEIAGLDRIPNSTITALGTEFILGRRVIDRYSVTFDHGRRVIVEY